MLIKVGNKIIDTQTTPVALIFKNHEESICVGNLIAKIPDGKDKFHVDVNGNWWLMIPKDSMNRQQIDEWSTLTDEQRELLNMTGEVTSGINI